MKSQKPYILTDNSENEENVVSEPAVAYTYANQNDYDALLIESFDEITSKQQTIFEPDEDFYNSISMEVVREKLHKVVDKLYAK
jgi:hypothetical protein